jgi:ATP-dependent Clp protease ATP-binding subunit ClpA
MEVTDRAKDLLAEKGFDPALGARPLRRVIQRSVLDPLSLKVVAGEILPGGKVRVDEENKEIVLLVTMDSLKASSRRKLAKASSR